MKIAIVSIYSNNFGSFFQASALSNYLQGLGHETYFANNINNVSHYMRYVFLRACKRALVGGFKEAQFIFKLNSAYRRARKSFKFSSFQKDTDVVVYGSDTIWNLEDPTFNIHRKKFWGLDYDGAKFTYAVSLANTPACAVLGDNNLVKALNDFKAISVRDEYTRSVINQIVDDEKITSVIDPTMLLDVDYYKNIMPECEDKDFIFVYMFDELTQEAKSTIKQFAKEKGKKIITVAPYISWTDKTIYNSPYEILSYFYNADYVITDTFHGNIFSIIFNKQYVSIERDKNKVNNLLKLCGLEHRNACDKDALLDALQTNINYDVINAKIEKIKQDSKKYINTAPETIKGNI